MMLFIVQSMSGWVCGRPFFSVHKFRESHFSIFQLVKDIRRLVDSGEFLANKHCKNSPVVKLIITLLLELIT